MKRVYELDVYKLAKELSDMVWHNFDKWNKKVQAKFPISNFYFLISTFRERLQKC